MQHIDQPTHWMPLPAPPIEAGTDALNTARMRSAKDAALDMAIEALWYIKRYCHNAPVVADRVLSRIDALLPKEGGGKK